MSFQNLTFIDKVGQGRFAAVYRAKNVEAEVAVKVFPNTQLSRDSWTRECDIYTTPELEHKYILGFRCSVIPICQSCIITHLLRIYVAGFNSVLCGAQCTESPMYVHIVSKSTLNPCIWSVLERKRGLFPKVKGFLSPSLSFFLPPSPSSSLSFFLPPDLLLLPLAVPFLSNRGSLEKGSELWIVSDYYSLGSLHDLLKKQTLTLRRFCDLAESAAIGKTSFH